MYPVYKCKINVNSHIAAMTETDYPTLCNKHLDEVKQDGDLIRGIGSPQLTEGSCSMCQAERKA